MELREWFARFVAEGGSRRDAAQRLAVSAGFSVKLPQGQEYMRYLAPLRQERPLGSDKFAPCTTHLIQTVEGTPDITMPELTERLLFAQGATRQARHAVALPVPARGHT
jgi:hypothetical protein